MSVKLIYDGTFEGFLTAVFEVFEQKLKMVIIEPYHLATETLFGGNHNVITDHAKAMRVWNGIYEKGKIKIQSTIYKAFLSEQTGIENMLLDYIKKVFTKDDSVFGNFTDPSVLKISKIVKSVDREKHRMDAFVRFKLTKDDIYFATVEPDFNVLPLNAKHFKKRYADQKWIIYDLKRNYGLYYDLNSVTRINLELEPSTFKKEATTLFFTPEELAYETLWRNYFKSTNIESRKNMTLHLKHIPKRYWKYLSEKQP